MGGQMTIRIKNWAKHQHFKDRTPPWIKLYRDILDDPDWHDLSGEDAKMLVNLWLLASEDENKAGSLPDARRIAFRLRTTVSKTEQQLLRLKHWLVQDDINAISEQYQVDAPETEREAEREREEETEEKPRKRVTPAKPDAVDQQTWDDWIALRKAKRAPVTQTVIDGALREAGKAGMTLEAFLQVWCRRGSQGLEAAWLKPEERSQPMSFAQQDAAEKRRRWEEMTGRKWPEEEREDTRTIDFIDAEPSILRIDQ
jgi:hypothetical protein